MQAFGPEFSNKAAFVRDLLVHRNLGSQNGSFTAASVPAHGCSFVTINFV